MDSYLTLSILTDTTLNNENEGWFYVFSGLLISFHPSIMQSLLPQLSSPRLAVRKRAIIALGLYMS